MAKTDNAKQRSGTRDKHTWISPSAAKLKQILGDSPGYRNLTPYEIELLRKTGKETAEVVREVLAGKVVNGDVIIEN